MSNINPVTEASVEATPLPPQPAVTNPVGTAAPMLPVEDKPLNLGGHEFQSRFILGSGRYDLNLIKATVEHAGTQIVTMALRRAQTTENSVLDYIPEGITLLPNTSGARNAEEAVRIARLAREVCQTDFVKVEIEHETKYLLPDNEETIRATEMLAKEGFVVMPYMFPDPIAAKRLEEAGAACVMPLGSLIGSNKGLRMRDFIEVIIANTHVPVIIDAGIGRPSQAAEAMEMGAAAIMQTALSLISSGLGVAACTLTLAALRRYDLDGELSSAVMAAVGRLSRFCAAALAAMLLLSAAVELANVLARPLGVSLLSVNFPVSALICCFAVLLGARLVAAHKRLKDDNDLFV